MVRGKKRWTDVKEQVRQRIVLDSMSPEEIRVKGIAGWDTIRDTVVMMKRGEAPPLRGEGLTSTPLGDVNVGKPKGATLTAQKFNESSFLQVVPRTFTTTSVSIWLAMQLAIMEWNWPENMTPGQFLDRFIPMAMKDYGYLLAGYIKLPGAEVVEEVEESESQLLTRGGNGDRQEAKIEATEEVEDMGKGAEYAEGG